MGTTLENRKIEIDQKTLRNLNVTRKWSMFIAILGFILLGLIIVIGALAGTFLSAFNSGQTGPGLPESLMLAIYFVLGAVYFFPVLFLFRFSKHTTYAVQYLDKQALYQAFRYLKLYFVYLGILKIIVLSLYIVALVAAGSSMAFLKGLG